MRSRPAWWPVDNSASWKSRQRQVPVLGGLPSEGVWDQTYNQFLSAINDLQRLKLNLELTWSIRILLRTSYLKNNSKEMQGWRGKKIWMAETSEQKQGPWEPVLSRTSLEWFISTSFLASCKGLWYSLSLPYTHCIWVTDTEVRGCKHTSHVRFLTNHLWVNRELWAHEQSS